MENLTNIQRYVRPSHYAGETYESYFVVYGRNRDSDILTESNFEELLKRLDGESETVIITRASHWACGWVEQLLVHESDAKALEIADSLIGEINNYPVLNDEDFFRREAEARENIWSVMDLKERICTCVKARVSIFASRFESVPERLEQYIQY